MTARLTDEEEQVALTSGLLLCVRCQRVKGLSEFTPRPGKGIGVARTCRRCHADKQKFERQRRGDHVRARERDRQRPSRTENHRAWRAANRAKSNASMRAATQRRRARLHDCDVRQVTLDDLNRLAERQEHRCFYCGEKRKLTIDHLIAVARGGRHAIGNLVLACFACNRHKATQLPVEFRTKERV